ncbi:MAG: hypothetical protein AAB611_01665 [Patescibacteria group bacterium]
MRTFLIFLSIVLAGVLALLYLSPSRQNTRNNTQQEIVGAPDEYGCIPGAGYSWCETKKKCLRPWEEACK